MADSISINLFGDEHFRRVIRKISYRAIDMEPVLHHIGADWQDVVEEQFETEGARSGRKWADLARDTWIRRGTKHPILIESGDMFQEFITPDNVKVTHDSVTMHLGNEEAKAASHQYGFTNAATGRDVPARPIVRFTAEDRARWRNQISDYLIHGRLPL